MSSSNQKKPDSGYLPLQIKVDYWAPARIVFQQFLEAHPELGLIYSENTYQNFTRNHAKKLVAKDVMRRSYVRAPYTADVRRFDEEAYELISRQMSPESCYASA
jgi:hypothetical protein